MARIDESAGPGEPNAFLGSSLTVLAHIHPDMSVRIRLRDETYEALDSLRHEGETFDEVISRLLDARDERSGNESSPWDGTDAAEKARSVRNELKRELDRNRTRR